MVLFHQFQNLVSSKKIDLIDELILLLLSSILQNKLRQRACVDRKNYLSLFLFISSFSSSWWRCIFRILQRN